MKKLLLTIAVAASVLTAQAQKARIVDAKAFLADKDYSRAIKAINEATMPGSETATNPKAWHTRAIVFYYAYLDSTSKVPNAADEMVASVMKAAEVGPNYNDDGFNQLVQGAANVSYNEAIQAYNAKDFQHAYDLFNRVGAIYGVNNGKRFEADFEFMRLARESRRNAAVAATYAEKYPEAIAIYNTMKTKPDADTLVYMSLMEIYTKQKDDASYASTLQDARQRFPDNVTFRMIDLARVANGGDASQLLKAMEEAVAADPGNADLYGNLGTSYMNAAFPKDKAGNDLARPANADELVEKARTAFENGIKYSGGKAEFNYNMGALYYNKAALYNSDLNTLVGANGNITPSIQKQYDAIKVKRDAEFRLAMPYLEQAFNSLDARKAEQTPDEKNTYLNTMYALREVYSRVGTKAQQDMVKAKLDAM